MVLCFQFDPAIPLDVVWVIWIASLILSEFPIRIPVKTFHMFQVRGIAKLGNMFGNRRCFQYGPSGCLFCVS